MTKYTFGFTNGGSGDDLVVHAQGTSDKPLEAFRDAVTALDEVVTPLEDKANEDGSNLTEAERTLVLASAAFIQAYPPQVAIPTVLDTFSMIENGETDSYNEHVVLMEGVLGLQQIVTQEVTA